MKIKWLLLSLSALTIVLCSFMPYPGGAPSPYYYTGSPSDGHNCSQCHGNASLITGAGQVDLSTVSISDYSTAGATGGSSYYWNITPPEAGAISGTGLTGTVTWNPAFLGLAYIRAKALNECGDGGWSDSKEVYVINGTGLIETSKASLL